MPSRALRRHPVSFTTVPLRIVACGRPGGHKTLPYSVWAETFSNQYLALMTMYELDSASQ